MPDTGLQVTIQSNLTPDVVLNPLSGAGSGSAGVAAKALLKVLQPRVTVTAGGAPIYDLAPAGAPTHAFGFVLVAGVIAVVLLAGYGALKLAKR